MPTELPALRLNPRQQEAIDTLADPAVEEILLDGSVRAGKTQIGARAIVSWAYVFGGTYLVCRQTEQKLKDSTLKAIIRGEGGLNSVLPTGISRGYIANEMTVRLKNGAEILFRSAETPAAGIDKIKNITLNGFLIDQAEELDDPAYEEFYDIMLGRLSDPRGPGKAILITNPSHEDHWIYRRFIDENTREPQTRRVHFRLWDNEDNLDPSYFRKAMRSEKTRPDYFERYVLGEWGAFGGRRFKCFKPFHHVIPPFAVPEDWEVIEGIDFGSRSPTCCIWVAQDFQGRYYAIGEHYEAEQPISFHARRIKEMRAMLGVDPAVTYLDPSAFNQNRREYNSVAINFSDHEIYCSQAQNDRVPGWNLIEELLLERLEDGKPRLQVFETCSNLIRQLKSARYREHNALKPNTPGDEDIQKKNDHALDALRYVVSSRPPLPIERKEDEEPDRRQQLAKRLLTRAAEREQAAVYTA
jgi:PBSX family phage terminase large subunit